MTESNIEKTIDVVQRDAEELAKNYPKWFRRVEWVSLISFFSLFFILLYKILMHANELWTLFIPGFILGWIAADFACGFVHWLADTWGSADMPILGAALIRPFREHHVDPLAMTKHDFVETNAAASLGGIPVYIGCLFIPIGADKPFFSLCFFFLFSLTIFGLFTNQIHKWAHNKNAPKIIQALQKRHLILNPMHHKIHHTPPFNKYYCITTGWLNPFLKAIHFFPTCEKLIIKYTGALPRRDDIGEMAARKISE